MSTGSEFVDFMKRGAFLHFSFMKRVIEVFELFNTVLKILDDRIEIVGIWVELEIGPSGFFGVKLIGIGLFGVMLG